MQFYASQAPNFCQVFVLEALDKLFIASESYHTFARKYLLFDRSEGEGILLDNGSGLSKGFVNDIDGGLDFWPLGIVNDNQVYMPIDILTLKKELEKIKSGEKTVKYQDRQKELEKLISNSDISDNPVLMIVTLKK